VATKHVSTKINDRIAKIGQSVWWYNMDPPNSRWYNPISVVHDNTVKTTINVNVVETTAICLKDLNHDGNSLFLDK
jgi:hypothetical protein